jgi:peptidoglycan hydrolase-like protein with peptidoglycan-binding domain
MKPGVPDSILGSQTTGAIKRYEEANGRPQTGNIDSEILERLRQEKPISQAEAEGKPKPAAAARQQAEQAEAALNLSDQARKRVQLALTALGHEVPATGYFGPITRRMIAEWQKKQGLPPSGLLDSPQLAALQQQAAPAFAKQDQR